MSVLGTCGRRSLSSAAGSLDQISCLGEIRSVLRLSGPTLVHFLQGLLTNDVTILEKANPSTIYSCILNAQGRYLHDLFLHPLPSTASDNGPAVLLDTHAAGKDDLLRLLKRYRLRQKIEIDDMSEELQVWTRFGPKLSDTLAVSQNQQIESWPQDPRLPHLGLRAVLPKGSFDSGSIASKAENIEVVPWETYRRWRINLGVAEGDEEIPSGDAIALEYNIDGLNGISFTKGCYVGQELMARTHFKGVVRKRVMPFEIRKEESVQVESGSGIVDSSSGKTVGNVRVVDGKQGLAVFRLKEAHEAMDGGRKLVLENSGVEMMPQRPAWWPETWGREQ